MRGEMIGSVILLAASASFAQRAPDHALAGLGFKVVQPMTSQEIASAQAKVDASLSKGNYSALFDNVTDSAGGKARHRASGLVCPLGKKGQQIVSATSDAAECLVENGSIYRTTVTRAPDGATLDSLEAAAKATVEKEPDYEPAHGAQIVARPNPGSGLPEHRTIRFVSKIDGHKRASHLAVGLIHGWVLTERHEYPDSSPPPIGMSELLQETMFGTSIK